MFTGMRRGEAIGLRWEDSNPTDQLIYIRRSVTFHNNQPIIGSPKSVAGIRNVPLDKRLQAILAPHWAEGYVVGNGIKPITESAFSRTWERIEKTIDLHGATPHILRHTYITLVSTAIDIKTLQTIAVHADIQTTMNRYVHPQTDKIVEAGRILEQALQCDQV